MNIKTWKNYEKLSDLTNFLIALRREDKSETLNMNFPFDYGLIEGEKLNLSSSHIRNKIKENDLSDNDLPQEIIKYIKENSLY